MSPPSRPDIQSLPKAELHRHIEGCVRAPTILRIAKKHKLPLPTFDEAELDKLVRLRAPMKSLEEVLRMFSIAQSVFVSLEAIEELVWELLERAYSEENIRLLELRYSPDFMLKGKNLDWQEAFDRIHSTLERFEKTHAFCGGLILIASRSFGMESAQKTAEFALRNKGRVIGFDLADSESAYPPSLYAGLAARLREAGIPLTVHSGEEAGWESVLQTLELLKPRRIGHGVRAVEDPSGRTLGRIKAEGVTIETNPWSNYLTHSVPSLETHPLPKFLKLGVRASIGADDPDLLDTDLNKEYGLAVDRMGLTMDDLRLANRCAVEGSFLPEDKRQEAAKLIGEKPEI
ncbi:MAG TPA: adenosine deaminase [Elusimicrobia bacterium]|nr:adenosine deaminase [Elusimicrobiota bacterium]